LFARMPLTTSCRVFSNMAPRLPTIAACVESCGLRALCGVPASPRSHRTRITSKPGLGHTPTPARQPGTERAPWAQSSARGSGTEPNWPFFDPPRAPPRLATDAAVAKAAPSPGRRLSQQGRSEEVCASRAVPTPLEAAKRAQAGKGDEFSWFVIAPRHGGPHCSGTVFIPMNF
jgi:hypothetical protein